MDTPVRWAVVLSMLKTESECKYINLKIRLAKLVYVSCNLYLSMNRMAGGLLGGPSVMCVAAKSELWNPLAKNLVIANQNHQK